MELTGRPFSEVLGELLSALGRSADRLAITPGELEDSLRGQGLEAAEETLPAGGVPDDADMVAALVELQDGGWLALLPGGLRLDGAPLPDELPTSGRVVLLRPQIDSLRQIAPFLRRHRARLGELMAAGLIINLLVLVIPLFGAFVYDKVLGNGITETLWALAIGLTVVIGIDLSVRAVRALLVERFSVATEADIDRTLFSNLLALDAARVPAVGLVLDKYKQILASRDFLSSGYLLAVLDLPFLLLFLLAIFMVAGPLALVPLLFGALLLGVHLLLTIPAEDYQRQARLAGEKRFALLADVLMAREIVVGGRLRGELLRRWRRASDRAGVAGGRARYWHALAGSFSVSATNLAYVAVIVAGAYMIEARALTTGGLLAVSMLTSRFMGTIGALVLLVSRYREFRQSLRELDLLLPDRSDDQPCVSRPPGSLRGQLRLVGVGLQLRREGRPILRQIDLTIPPGQMVGIAGRPGAGKTSLLRLMAGLLEPDQGQVSIDNVPVSALEPDHLSAAIGYKPQEPTLLDGTVEDNVRAGNQTAPAAKVNAALALAGLAEAFEQGELTLATPVGPRGSALSGGQRQMVGLARALVGEPPVLLLDEPTAGLDPRLESRLADRLAEIRGKATVVVCTHSRALLAVCDRILVLDHGQVVADGPREKVLVDSD